MSKSASLLFEFNSCLMSNLTIFYFAFCGISQISRLMTNFTDHIDKSLAPPSTMLNIEILLNHLFFLLKMWAKVRTKIVISVCM